MPSTDADHALDEELSGLDHLETATGPSVGRVARLWSATWPKLAAIALALFLWQCVVWSHWRAPWLLPPPRKAFNALGEQISNGTLWTAIRITMKRAAIGFGLAIVIGSVVGAFVSRIRVLRVAFGSFITGLQTMPSIAWFPLSLLLFKRSEAAILFVVVLGGAPAIANGLISGVDNIPPLLLRAGRTLGARGLTLFRRVVLPASLPGYVAGLKQGWAFGWRSLMAGELLVIIPGKQSIGVQLQASRDFADAPGLMAEMIVILVIGIVIDAAFFGTIERRIRTRWGLIDQGR